MRKIILFGTLFLVSTSYAVTKDENYHTLLANYKNDVRAQVYGASYYEATKAVEKVLISRCEKIGGFFLGKPMCDSFASYGEHTHCAVTCKVSN